MGGGLLLYKVETQSIVRNPFDIVNPFYPFLVVNIKKYARLRYTTTNLSLVREGGLFIRIVTTL